MFKESGLWNEMEKLRGGFDEILRAGGLGQIGRFPAYSLYSRPDEYLAVMELPFTGAFERAIPIPTEVDGDKIHARVQDGLLFIRLPKLEKEKPRTVKID